MTSQRHKIGGQGRDLATPQPWRPICYNNDRHGPRHLDESATPKVDALTFLPASMLPLIIVSFDLSATFRLGCSGPTKFVQRVFSGLPKSIVWPARLRKSTTLPHF
ncbi:uncharacterized protein CDAR_371641 [Caerostris darwini]|uniref:Uncharacterized protein n=1 Tax=Caerostris darwini TaxID=1538125 RepID=A0AAV4XAT6_9ARAC|nr:uncharacterized protein CDAR_371641 [Caerostris darwini]